MGCASSKQNRCSHCESPYSTRSPVVPRSYSMHVHHPPQSKGDSYHVVALTSTTLGSLDHLSNKEFSAGLIEAKNWSNMIEDRLPKGISSSIKTPITTTTTTTPPPPQPETINTWELMQGLEEEEEEEESPLRSPKKIDFSKSLSSAVDKEEEQSEETSDCDVDFKDKVVVLYLTSLRGVRKTYEDCCNVRLILKGLRVKVDERDVSLHSGFKEELKELIDDNKGWLPMVFVGRSCVGGAEEIQRLHEDGMLEKLLQRCQKIGSDENDDHGGCEACGDVRFVPCQTCCGSCKLYYEDNEVKQVEDGYYGFKRCPDCNENGLIRCPICCCSLLTLI